MDREVERAIQEEIARHRMEIQRLHLSQRDIAEGMTKADVTGPQLTTYTLTYVELENAITRELKKIRNITQAV